MAVQKSKKTRSRRGMRRSHDALTGNALSVDSVTGVVTISDIIITIPSSGYSYSEGLVVTKNMVGGQNDTEENLGSTTLAKFTINQVGNAVVTNEEHERNLNEDKHLIRYIEPAFIGRVVDEFVNLVSS